MNILILGDPNSIWVKRYVSNVLSNPDYKVVVFSENEYKRKDSDYGENVRIICCKTNLFLKKIRLSSLDYLLKLRKFLRKMPEMDCAHIHYVNKRKLFALKLLKKKCKKIVATFWGSDLLRNGIIETKPFLKNYSNIDCITVGSRYMKDYFIDRCSVAISEKVHIIRFGVDVIDKITQLLPEYVKQQDGSIHVTIGYNGSKAQNHIDVLDEIGKLPSTILDRLYITIPATYGLSPDYSTKLQQKLLALGVKYRLLTDFMNSEEMAQMELSTDVFIHAQKTDALSASVQEFLAAGKIVLNPKWLDYAELKEESVFYYEYETFCDLSGLLQRIIINGIPQEDQIRLQTNIKKMRQISSWEYLKNDWLDVYH